MKTLATDLSKPDEWMVSNGYNWTLNYEHHIFMNDNKYTLRITLELILEYCTNTWSTVIEH